MKFVEICALDDIPPGKSYAVRAGTSDVALFNVDGVVHAIENACMHAGSALLRRRIVRQIRFLPGPWLALQRDHRRAGGFTGNAIAQLSRQGIRQQGDVGDRCVTTRNPRNFL